ncbi:RNA polymerase sigma factor [Aminipila luticellarii]|uniref:RNA polymerase sigma factor n=1 Tax=Aminipila luticellarii TaxID=2507160 RepID=A0A410PVZ2_9FIRM|nr:RNA polymerase sigma factor [Aminipila luticellarii]QAT43046.1 RNA polymerase sigma factor [Aminipila luticellarii]
MVDNSAELVTRLQKGDTSSFEELFNLYKDRAVRTAYLITNNRSLADDIAQEAFIQCYFKIMTLRDPESFKTWFFRTLTRLAWKMSAKEKTAVPVENIFEFGKTEHTNLVEGEIMDKEESRQLMEAVKQLDIKQKTTVLLYYYNNFSVSEIAKIMGCFEGTVKSRLHTARKNLKKSIEFNEIYKMEGKHHEVIGKV